MKNQLSARSPFWQIVFMLHFFAFFIAYSAANRTSDANSYSLDFPEYSILIFISFILFTLWSMLSVRKYNRSTRGKKISIFQIKPAELIIDDERARAISTTATRAVYLYHNLAWPIAAIAIAMIQSVAIALLIIALVLLGHYLIYWYNIRALLV